MQNGDSRDGSVVFARKTVGFGDFRQTVSGASVNAAPYIIENKFTIRHVFLTFVNDVSEFF